MCTPLVGRPGGRYTTQNVPAGSPPRGGYEEPGRTALTLKSPGGGPGRSHPKSPGGGGVDRPREEMSRIPRRYSHPKAQGPRKWVLALYWGFSSFVGGEWSPVGHSSSPASNIVPKGQAHPSWKRGKPKRLFSRILHGSQINWVFFCEYCMKEGLFTVRK